jgi:SAM-dependent methyltransferase
MSREDVRTTRRTWEADSDGYQERNRAQLNRWDRLAWGIWDVPEDEIHALGDVTGLDVLELGCGGCQSGIKVAMRGAKVVGVDVSATQLQHARRNIRGTGVRLPIVQGSAEELPFADERFDLVFCDHGATSFTDPHVTIPEAARVLRPGGFFVFNHATPIVWMAWPDDDHPADRSLHRAYFGMGRTEVTGETGTDIEWQLPYGDWIRLFRSSGLIVEDLIELQPDPDASTTYEGYAPVEWARDFPGEHIWKVRKA